MSRAGAGVILQQGFSYPVDRNFLYCCRYVVGTMVKYAKARLHYRVVDPIKTIQLFLCN